MNDAELIAAAVTVFLYFFMRLEQINRRLSRLEGKMDVLCQKNRER